MLAGQCDMYDQASDLLKLPLSANLRNAFRRVACYIVKIQGQHLG